MLRISKMTEQENHNFRLRNIILIICALVIIWLLPILFVYRQLFSIKTELQKPHEKISVSCPKCSDYTSDLKEIKLMLETIQSKQLKQVRCKDYTKEIKLILETIQSKQLKQEKCKDYTKEIDESIKVFLKSGSKAKAKSPIPYKCK